MKIHFQKLPFNKSWKEISSKDIYKIIIQKKRVPLVKKPGSVSCVTIISMQENSQDVNVRVTI